MQTIGVGIIARNAEATIEGCIKSLIKHVNQCVVVLAGKSDDKTEEIVRSFSKVEVYNFEWCDDFAAARNFSFSKLKTDWLFWVDADDVVYQPENLRKLADTVAPEIGGIWFQYHYAIDEFRNVCTLYERERLLRARHGWIWRGRIHETVSPLVPCQYVRTDQVIIRHNHLSGTPRNERNFRILNIMLKENPEDKRIWLYLGHQHFANQEWMKSAEWYLKFGQDNGAIPLERFQALCYCSKALREMRDPQAIQVALSAIELFPEYKDGYLELAHSYHMVGQFDKAIHFAKLSDVKELIREPPSIIFINPTEYTVGRYSVLADSYLRKGDLNTALEYAKQIYVIRPLPEIKRNIEDIEHGILQNRVTDSVKTLAIHLLNNQEIVKLPHLLEATPYWFRESPEYLNLRAGILHYTEGMDSKPQLTVDEKNNVTVNIANAYGLEELLEDLGKKHDKITIIAPFPSAESKQINVLSQADIERLISNKEGRHVINLRQENDKIICEYDKNPPQGMFVRFFLGQGLEYWSPQTIADIGCGGSETAVAMIAKEFARQDHLPIIYAMNNEIWDGVMYRHYSKFNPQGNPCNLFISSRVPEVFNNDLPTKQRWLWMHDIHCGNRLTPDIASQLDAIIVLSHWHVEHIKRVYPFLTNAQVIDMDDQDKTYDDMWTGGIFYADEKCDPLPKIAIIGNGLDVERFRGLKGKKVPHRFIWCSSPDRGLEQLLNIWPMIRQRFPDAELKIFYGWEYFMHSLVFPEQRELRERLRLLIRQAGVEWCGRIGQKQLAKELDKAEAMVYPPPHNFRETYGIAFLEAQAAGVICFYRQNGALGETIGDRGVPLALDMKPEEMVDKIVATLNDKEACGKIRREGRKYALKRSWAKQAEKMLALYKIIEEGNNGSRSVGFHKWGEDKAS